MHDLARMRYVERLGHLADHSHHTGGCEVSFPTQGVLQLFAVEQLHDERSFLSAEVDEVENTHDAVVHEHSAQGCFALEALDLDWVGRDGLVQDLHGDATALDQIERLVDAPHAAIGNDPPHLVARCEGLADSGVRLGPNGNLAGTDEACPVDRTEGGIRGIKPSTAGAGVHDSPLHCSQGNAA